MKLQFLKALDLRRLEKNEYVFYRNREQIRLYGIVDVGIQIMLQ